ncbi:hypothetical protein ACU637_21285 [Klebsiella aerogenes]
MDRKKRLWQNLKLHSDLHPELTIEHHFELLIEQIRVERYAFSQEIKELRELLQKNNVSFESIESGLSRSDAILDKLLRYQQGKSGKLSGKGILVMPYRWRRKVRNTLS